MRVQFYSLSLCLSVYLSVSYTHTHTEERKKEKEERERERKEVKELNNGYFQWPMNLNMLLSPSRPHRY